MSSLDLVFATKSNSKNPEEAFAPVFKTEKAPKLVYNLVATGKRSDEYQIDEKFLEGQVEFQGWNILIDRTNKRPLLVQYLTEEGAENAIFLSGTKTKGVFKSTALTFALTSCNIDITKPFQLTLVPDVLEGCLVYEVTNIVEESVSADSTIDDSMLSQYPILGGFENASVESVNVSNEDPELTTLLQEATV